MRKTFVVWVLAGLLVAAQAGAWELVRTEPRAQGATLASENGLYTSVATRGGDPMNPTIQRFSLAGPGGLLWSKEDFGENAAFIANDGKTVVGMKGSGVEGLPTTLTFYGPKSEKRAEVTIKGPSGTAFSQDGSTFFVRSLDLGIAAFGREGKKLWQVPGGREFTASADGKWLAVEDQGTLFLYDQGRLVSKAALGEPFAVALTFSPEGGYLAAATPHSLRVLKVKGLGLVWNTAIKETGKSFTSASLARDGEALAAGVDFDAGLNIAPEKRYPKGEVVLFGADGNRLWTKEVSLGGFAPHRPLVSLSPDGRTIRATCVDQTLIFEQH